MFRKSIGIALGWLCIVPCASLAATQAQIDQAWNKGLAWLLINQHGDGGWSSTLSDGNALRQGLGIQATAAAVDGMSAMDIKAGYSYLGGVAWLSNAEPASVDALARQVIALKPSGKNMTQYGTGLTAWRNAWNTWGAYAKYEHSVMDTALGLRAMLDVDAAYVEAGNAGCILLIGQHKVAPDYGWSHIIPPAGAPAGQSSSTITATVQAVLALYRWGGLTTSITCTGATTTTYTFTTVFANAVSWLITKQTADNGFGDNGTSGVLESALALRMLKTVEPSNAAVQTTLDYLIAQQETDGSWRSGDALQTAEVLSALAASSTVAGQRPSSTVATDTDKDGVPDSTETVMGTNPSVADSRYLADGSGTVVTQPAMMLAAATVQSAPQAMTTATVDGLNGPVTVWDKPADLEIFIAGTSAQFPILERALQSLFQSGTLETLVDDGGVRGAASGGLYRAYYGHSIGDGSRLLVHFSARGGSETGAVAVARAQPVMRMIVDADCVASDVNGRWSCPVQNTTDQVPDAGISEIQPAWYGGVNSSVAAPLSTTEIAALDASAINAMAFGVAASDALLGAGLESLTPGALARLMRGEVRNDWSEIDADLPAQPIVICRFGKGAQPAAEALMLGVGCKSGAVSAAAATASATTQLSAPGYLIAENASTEDVIGCLRRAQEGGVMRVNGIDIAVRPGSFAIGVVGAERVPTDIEHWGYIGLDGAMPVRDALMGGTYPHYAEAWMQWRTVAVEGAPVITGPHLSLLRDLRAALANAQVLGASQSTAVLGGSPGGMASNRGGDVCAAPLSVN